MDDPASHQVIVWCPPRRTLLYRLRTGAVRAERGNAAQQLSCLPLICYAKPDHVESRSQVVANMHELWPEQWLLSCPNCGGIVGPDLIRLRQEPILQRWIALHRPPLEDPHFGRLIKLSGPVVDLAEWIRKIGGETGPHPLELAYLGQQLWPNINEMLAAME
jgi:hypothetical protein